MNILWLNWRCWLNPAMGGAEVFTYEVAKRWVDLGIKLLCLLPNFQTPRVKKQLMASKSSVQAED